MEKINELYENNHAMERGFSSKTDILNYLLLKYLSKMQTPVGSWVLRDLLQKEGLNVSTATIGRALKNLDSQELTKLIEAQGRVITAEGIQYVKVFSEKIRIYNLQQNIMDAVQPKNIDELLDLMRVRKALECETARLAALRATDQNIEVLEKTVCIHEKCVETNDDPTKPALGFHGELAKSSNLRFLIASLDLLINDELWLEDRFIEITRERADEYTLHHRLIASAIRERDPDEANHQMGIHMDAIIEDLKNLAD
ncbi:FadR/GntR family transcriptional regulator [Thalassobacillus sp. C254]|uniref:FadR/GntR family transcriptional regulator n=1 Tax=Thalassobacillus sp. C254 TaxID=1225341 RepID=UPI0006D14D87|nr:FCD domain-containing protein [Thalassobacillus sp. C254]